MQTLTKLSKQVEKLLSQIEANPRYCVGIDLWGGQPPKYTVWLYHKTETGRLFMDKWSDMNFLRPDDPKILLERLNQCVDAVVAELESTVEQTA